MTFFPDHHQVTRPQAAAVLLLVAGSFVSCAPTSNASSGDSEGQSAAESLAAESLAAVAPPAVTTDEPEGDAVNSEPAGLLGIESDMEKVSSMLAQLEELGDTPDPKWFKPSAMLRDSLFDLDALKEHFSIEEKRSGGLRMHAQQDPEGA